MSSALCVGKSPRPTFVGPEIADDDLLDMHGDASPLLVNSNGTFGAKRDL